MKNARNSGIYLFIIVLLLFYIFWQGFRSKTPDPAQTVTIGNARSLVQQFSNFKVRLQDSSFKTFVYYNSETFTKRDVEALLAEKDCDGIRVYHAVENNGRSIMLMVGRNGNQRDLLPVPDSTLANASRSQFGNSEKYIIRSEVPCPQMCPDNGLSGNVNPE